MFLPPAHEQRPDASPETVTITDESVFEQPAPRFGRRARPTVFVRRARSLPDYLLSPHMLVARQSEYDSRDREAEERRQRREAAQRAVEAARRAQHADEERDNFFPKIPIGQSSAWEGPPGAW